MSVTISEINLSWESRVSATHKLGFSKMSNNPINNVEINNKADFPPASEQQQPSNPRIENFTQQQRRSLGPTDFLDLLRRTAHWTIHISMNWSLLYIPVYMDISFRTHGRRERRGSSTRYPGGYPGDIHPRMPCILRAFTTPSSPGQSLLVGRFNNKFIAPVIPSFCP